MVNGQQKYCLTILLTSYNYARYIDEALKRILLQLAPEFELVIIDDCSTDNTIDIIVPLIANNPNVRLIRNAENTGVHNALEMGLKLAQGDYFICAAADDHIRPGLLRESVDLLARHTTAALCTAPIEHMDEAGIRSGGWTGPELPDRVYLGPAEASHLMRRYGFWHAGGTTMFRTDLLRQAGGFNKRLGNLADSFVAQQLSLKHGFCSLSAVMSDVRILPESYSCSERYDTEKTYNIRLEAISVMEQHPDLFPASFIREWVDVWAFLDALKAWHRMTIWAQQDFLGPNLHRFRHYPGVLDKVFAGLVLSMGVLQFLVVCLWGLLALGRHRLFHRYIRPERFLAWLRNQIRFRDSCRRTHVGRRNDSHASGGPQGWRT